MLLPSVLLAVAVANSPIEASAPSASTALAPSRRGIFLSGQGGFGALFTGGGDLSLGVDLNGATEFRFHERFGLRLNLDLLLTHFDQMPLALENLDVARFFFIAVAVLAASGVVVAPKAILPMLLVSAVALVAAVLVVPAAYVLSPLFATSLAGLSLAPVYHTVPGGDRDLFFEGGLGGVLFVGNTDRRLYAGLGPRLGAGMRFGKLLLAANVLWAPLSHRVAALFLGNSEAPLGAFKFSIAIGGST